MDLRVSLSSVTQALSLYFTPSRLTNVGLPTSFNIMVENYRHAGTDDFEYRAPDKERRYTCHWRQYLRAGTAFNLTDERDLVYGIFGMVTSSSTRPYVDYRPDIDPSKLPIDYSKSVSEVYQDLTKYLINTDRNLDCLVVFEDHIVRELPDDQPSWVTDWRYNQPRLLLSLPPNREEDKRHYGLPPLQDLDQIGRLHLKAHVLFKIKGLSSNDKAQFRAISSVHHSYTSQMGVLRNLDSHQFVERMERSYIKCVARCYLKPLVRKESQLWVLGTSRIGDVVVILKGGLFPFVLHKLRRGDYILVGPVLANRLQPDAGHEMHESSFVERVDFSQYPSISGSRSWIDFHIV